MDPKDFRGYGLQRTGQWTALAIVTANVAWRVVSGRWLFDNPAIQGTVAILMAASGVALAAGWWINWRARRAHVRQRLEQIEAQAPRPPADLSVR